MKKTLILASLVAFAAITPVFAEEVKTEPAANPVAIEKQCPKMGPHKAFKKQGMHKKFEDRLNLTEEQKLQAKEIRKKGHQEIKPIMEKINSKKQEARAVRLSRIAVEEQEARLDQIDKELKVLYKDAQKLRIKNMKEFESILTKDQKKELVKIKKEGRKKFEREHKRKYLHHAGFGPGFGHGPALPPPKPPVEK